MPDPRAKYAVEADRAYERGEWLFAEIARQRGAELAMRAPEEWELDRVLKRGDEVYVVGLLPYVALARLTSWREAAFYMESEVARLKAALRELGALPVRCHRLESFSHAGYNIVVTGVMQ